MPIYYLKIQNILSNIYTHIYTKQYTIKYSCTLKMKRYDMFVNLTKKYILVLLTKLISSQKMVSKYILSNKLIHVLLMKIIEICIFKNILHHAILKCRFYKLSKI